MGFSGREMVEAMARGEMDPPPMVAHLGGSIGVAEAEVRDPDGALHATGRATYAVLRPDRDGDAEPRQA